MPLPYRLHKHLYGLQHATITFCEAANGTLTLPHNGKPVNYRVLGQGQPLTLVVDEKHLHALVEKAKTEQAQRSNTSPHPTTISATCAYRLRPAMASQKGAFKT